MTEVRIATALSSHADKQNRARLLVDAQHFGDVPLTGGDSAFELSAGEVVQVQMSPIIALREPQHLVRRPGDVPVLAVAPRLEVRRDALLEDIAYRARARVGNAQLRHLVIAR